MTYVFFISCYKFKYPWRQIAAATPVTSNRIRNVAAMIHRQATSRIQPVWLNGTTYRHVIPRERMRVEESSQVASFILRWFFLQRGGFLHSADAQGLNDIRYNVSTDSPTVSTTFHAAPRPSSGSPRRASFPQGKLLYRVGRHTASFLRRDNRKVPETAVAFMVHSARISQNASFLS